MVGGRDAPLDGDDPARRSGALGRGRVACSIGDGTSTGGRPSGGTARTSSRSSTVTAIGAHGRTLLGITLGAKEAGERGLATDVVALALADGRLTPSGLAEGLSAAAVVACDRPIRWARSLADVAAMSGEHASAVVAAIGQTLPALAERPSATLVPLLRLLDELSAATGSAAETAARPPLERLAGTGAGSQAGRLARSILARG